TADASRAYGERLLAEAARWLPELANASLERVTLGQRPFPVDGHPILGWAEGAPGIYLGVMHSGVTLAPLVGQFACSEILDGARIELLEAYRPSRFG
ncbi:MAG TPA: FAD-dependent oxidoreductase, partial [Myxococcota bacterium]|nr:FAD-dependent oxidoreductase [Myxococcota bacterium]